MQAAKRETAPSRVAPVTAQRSKHDGVSRWLQLEDAARHHECKAPVRAADGYPDDKIRCGAEGRTHGARLFAGDQEEALT